MRVKIRVISFILLRVSYLLFVGLNESITSPIRKMNDGRPNPVKPLQFNNLQEKKINFISKLINISDYM